jgi:TRAP transporter TAXI family solute receptor
MAVVAVLGGCGDDDDAATAPESTEAGDAADIPGGRISIATGGTSGVYFVLGGGIADLITRRIPGVEATAEVTAGSVDNLLLVNGGDSDVAFTLADTAADAVNGEEAFDAPLDVRALARLYTNYTQVVTTTGSGIEAVADLAGKRVSVGSPNSGTEVIANRILGVAGIEVKREQLGISESVSALRDGVIDAFFWSGGLPTGGITDLASTEKIRLLPLADVLAGMQDRYGDVYQAAAVPAGTYGLAAEIPSIGVANYLVVRTDMNEALAERITRLLFEEAEALAAVHPEARNITLAAARQVAPMELHPGATRYYEKTG